MQTRKSAWEGHLGGGHVSLCYAEGPTWTKVKEHIRDAVNAKMSFVEVKVSNDVLQLLAAEGEVDTSYGTHLYLEYLDKRIVVDEQLPWDSIFILPLSESRVL